MEKNKSETPGGDIKELVVQNNALTMEIKDLYENVSDLRISEKSLKNLLKNEKVTVIKIRSQLAECEATLTMAQESLKDRISEQERLKDRLSEQESVNAAQLEKLKKKINTLENKIFALNTSSSFRIGQVFVNAVVKPGKNTILLPFRFVRLMFEFVFAPKAK